MAQSEKSLGATQIEKAEHIEVNGVPAKRALIAGWDGTDLHDLNVDKSGSIILSGVPKAGWTTTIDESSAPATTVITILIWKNLTHGETTNATRTERELYSAPRKNICHGKEGR